MTQSNIIVPGQLDSIDSHTGQEDYELHSSSSSQHDGGGVLVDDPVAIPDTAATAAPAETTDEDINILEEASSVIGGGAIDAVESVGGFAELTGDTFKTGLNALLGAPNDATQNPFDANYVHGDGDWLNVPDQLTDWNGNVIWEDNQPKTAIGRFGRGLVEFGLLTWATGGVGGAALGGARVSTRGIALARSMGVGAKGSRYLKLLGKGAKVGSEGAIADLISTSSEHANIMNLAQDNIPWAVPIIGDMIAVKPEDNPWTARFKSILAGAGMNYVGHAVGAIYKGFWEAGRARMAGKSVDEANIIGNEAAAADFEANIRADENAHVEMAIDQYQQGRGQSRANPMDEYARTYGSPEEYDEFATKRASGLDEDAVRSNELFEEFKTRGNEAGDEWLGVEQNSTKNINEQIGRPLDAFVNDNRFAQNERATYRAPDDAVRKNLQERIVSTNKGGDGSSYTPLISEPYLKAISRGDSNIRQYINEVADDITDVAFKDLENRIPWKDVKTIILKQANELTEILEQGGNLSKAFKESLEDPNKNTFRLYADGPGTNITTISPTQKAASVLVLKALGEQAHAIATGALSIADNMPIARQTDMVFDNMKVLIEENKKMGMMWGLDGKVQQKLTLEPTLENMKKQALQQLSQENDEYFSALRSLISENRYEDMRDLMELHALSDGKVRTLNHIHDYLKAVLKGGRMDTVKIKGRLRKELQGTFYNSVLSSFSTPVKAVFGTNMIANLRPLQALIGSGIARVVTGRAVDEKSMFMASAQMDSMGKAWAESLQMAKHNWDLGLKRKGQTYQGKFDYEADVRAWKQMKRFYDSHGTPVQQLSYSTLDKIVDINSSPWLKYSVNAMGAGDAAARTMIGRQYMRQRAAANAWDEAASKTNMVDKKILKEVTVRTEENFRNEIFKQDKDGFWVVSDKGASMAGDEAAMTRALEENFKGFELISNIAGMKAFFPFVRTGFNYLDLTFKHTPLELFRNKYNDLKALRNKPNPSQAVLQKYNIKPQDLDYELAIIEGRVAMGTTVIGLATLAALSGRMTGTMPVNKTDRDLWKLNGIQPNSFILPNGTYASYEKLEIFNTLFSTTANVVGNSNILGEKRTDEWLKKLAFMTSAVIVDQSMLSGVEDLARLMNPRSTEDLILKSGSRYVRAHLPYSGLMGQIGDIVDANRKEANTFNELLVQRDVGFRNSVPNKYDVLNESRTGEPLVYGPHQPLWRLINHLSPIGIYDHEGDTLKETLYAMRYNLPEELGTYRGEPLNSLEKSEMQRILATSDLRKDLIRVINTREFRNAFQQYKNKDLKESDGYKLSQQKFTAMIRKVFSRHKALAIKQLMKENPVLASRLSLRYSQARMGRQGNYQNTERIDYLISQFPR